MIKAGLADASARQPAAHAAALVEQEHAATGRLQLRRRAQPGRSRADLQDNRVLLRQVHADHYDCLTCAVTL